jgi:SAM-dependent methyltransferase
VPASASCYPKADVTTDHLENLRTAEIAALRHWFRPGSRVLEIGGGNGYHASLIASWGCDVVSIDLEQRRPWPRTYFEVKSYDGRHIPAPDASFDLVFSSNVLVEIPAEPLGVLLDETHRVLAPGGVAAHILPSTAWRLWTNLTHYAYVGKRALGIPHLVPGEVASPAGAGVGATVRRRGLGHVLKRAVLPPPIGPNPSAFAELVAFRRGRWAERFRAHRFEIVEACGNDLFYTGVGLLPRLPLSARRRLARVLGAAATSFVLKPV